MLKEAPLELQLKLILKHLDNLVCGQMIMNGTNIFLFAVKKVPVLVNEILDKNKLTADDIDLFVFHQASYFMLEVIRKKMKVTS
jgi:3-oxoacyl-[acyl-carrier-protein] synthase III